MKNINQKRWALAVSGILILLLIPVIMLIIGVIELPNENPINEDVTKVNEPTGLYIEGFEENENTYYMAVQPEVENFDFSSVVVVADESIWKLSTDIMGMNTVSTKAVNLVSGNNLFYIGVYNGDLSEVYEVIIRQRPRYEVMFDARGGSEVNKQLVTEDAFIICPEAPSKLGYEFAGWMNGSDDYDFSRPVLEPITLVARWEAKLYTVTYVTDRGTMNITSEKVRYNSLFVPEIPEPDEYSLFYGWYVGGTRIEEGIWNFDTDVVLHAKWISTLYNIENGVVLGLTEKGEGLTELNIPSENGADIVTAIDANAFCYNRDIVRVNIPKTVKIIGDEAFYGCRNLSVINVEDDSMLHTIGKDAFSKTQWLNEAPEGEIYIGSTLFRPYIEGESYTVKEGILGIADNAFEGLMVKEIILCEGLIAIGDHAFIDCMELRNIILPISIEYIGDYAFYNTSLTELTIHSGVKYIGSNAFNGYEALTINIDMTMAPEAWHPLWNKGTIEVIYLPE